MLLFFQIEDAVKNSKWRKAMDDELPLLKGTTLES
jgi:hypothetical protein